VDDGGHSAVFFYSHGHIVLLPSVLDLKSEDILPG